jgi:hypothetical protein
LVLPRLAPSSCRIHIGPSNLFTNPCLKTVRAKEHLDDLGERLCAFNESKPYTVFREDDTKHQLHIVRFHLEDPPDAIPLIVGDFLYCLRASLDQLIWALAWRPSFYPRGTQFPIFIEPNPGKFRQYVSGVEPDAVSIIEDLQSVHPTESWVSPCQFQEPFPSQAYRNAAG